MRWALKHITDDKKYFKSKQWNLPHILLDEHCDLSIKVRSNGLKVCLIGLRKRVMQNYLKINGWNKSKNHKKIANKTKKRNSTGKNKKEWRDVNEENEVKWSKWLELVVAQLWSQTIHAASKLQSSSLLR